MHDRFSAIKRTFPSYCVTVVKGAILSGNISHLLDFSAH